MKLVHTEWRYSARSPFVFRKEEISFPVNLTRSSSVKEGKVLDGSSIGDSLITIPEEDKSIFDVKEYLSEKFNDEPDLRRKAEDLCKKYNTTLDMLMKNRVQPPIFVDSDNYRLYGDSHTYPMLKALFSGAQFVILDGGKNCGKLLGSFKPLSDYAEDMMTLEAVSQSVVAVSNGLLVAAPHRLFTSVFIVVLAFVGLGLSISYDDRSNYERFESGMFIWALILLTFPSIISLVSTEPEIIRNCIRGKKLLTRQSQVTEHFDLTPSQFAMLSTRLRGSKLVSHEVGYFLTGDERGAQLGDEAVVTCDDLAPYGVVCGRSVYYRANWQKVYRAERLGISSFSESTTHGNKIHLSSEEPKTAFWSAGIPPKTSVV